MGRWRSCSLKNRRHASGSAWTTRTTAAASPDGFHGGRHAETLRRAGKCEDQSTFGGAGATSVAAAALYPPSSAPIPRGSVKEQSPALCTRMHADNGLAVSATDAGAPIRSAGWVLSDEHSGHAKADGVFGRDTAFRGPRKATAAVKLRAAAHVLEAFPIEESPIRGAGWALGRWTAWWIACSTA